MTRGGVTPLPMRKAPPPAFPPSPGPTPGPVPGPTPVPLPSPIPAQQPFPFDGITAEDLGSPRFGIVILAASLRSGCTITVGSTGNFGAGFRITASGGVICCIENLGNRP